jgi:hypothetical protein
MSAVNKKPFQKLEKVWLIITYINLTIFLMEYCKKTLLQCFQHCSPG